jgi:predicted RNase H-like HicB family nuclease
MQYQGLKYFARHNVYNDGHELFFPDLPECCSAAETYEEALRDAQRHLGWSVLQRIRNSQLVPVPSSEADARRQAEKMQEQIDADSPDCHVMQWDMVEAVVDVSPW